MKDMQTAIENLCRGRKEQLDAYFKVTARDLEVENTLTQCHVHYIELDGNGRPRVEALIDYLINCLVDYAIPRKELDDAVLKYNENKSSSEMIKLFVKAKGLFSRLSKSGEGGELIMFLLAEKMLNLPQLICKMNLKTSTEMHYHGADGLHLGLDSQKEKLCLYWGESKLYGDVNGAIYNCMKSIAPLLNGNGGVGSPEKRDLHLLSGFLDLNNRELEDAVKSYLDPDSVNFNKLEFRGLCLVGFDIDKYPKKPGELVSSDVERAVLESVSTWSGQVGKRVLEENIDKFSMHVFLIPFPSVDEFRSQFKAALGD